MPEFQLSQLFRFVEPLLNDLPSIERKRVLNHLSKCIDIKVYRQFCSNRWSEIQREALRMNNLEELRRSITYHFDDSLAISGFNSWKTAFYAGLLKKTDTINWLFERRNHI